MSQRIQRDIWYKLWGNMTMNPVSAFTGATVDRILDDDLANGFCPAVMREARDIGAAIGCPIEQTVEARNAITRKLGAFRTSMLQDVEAGKPLEIDALLTVVREIGGGTSACRRRTSTRCWVSRACSRGRAGSIPRRRRRRRARTGGRAATSASGS